VKILLVDDLNFLAIIVGGLMYMMFGALYFSPILFGNSWVQLHTQKTNDGLKYGGSAIIAFISSFLVSLLVHATNANGLMDGIFIGLTVGIIIALVYLKNALFGLMTKKAYAIAVGDHIIAFSLLGGLHGLWM
jgi:Protein of unknown function (DUF1761)